METNAYVWIRQMKAPMPAIQTEPTVDVSYEH